MTTTNVSLLHKMSDMKGRAPRCVPAKFHTRLSMHTDSTNSSIPVSVFARERYDCNVLPR